MDNQETQPPLQPAIPPAPVYQSPNNSYNWFKTLAIGFTIVAFCIALGIIGYILGTRKNNQVATHSTQKHATQKQQVSVVSPTISNPTANWKTYNNIQYNFSFQYPQSYSLSYSDCSSSSNIQTSCLITLIINPSNNKNDPTASFWLSKGVNNTQLLGQIASIHYNVSKKAWVFSQNGSSDQVLPSIGQTKSGLDIIKGTNGGSEESSYYYIIPDYTNDTVAIFQIPQSFRLRCDLILQHPDQQTECNNFYQSVINKYGGGKTISNTWLPENYINFLYSDAETMVKSFDFTANKNLLTTSLVTPSWKQYANVSSAPDYKPIAIINYPSTWTYTEQSLKGTADLLTSFKDDSGNVGIELQISSRNFNDDYLNLKQQFGTPQIETVNGKQAYLFHSTNSTNGWIDAYYFPIDYPRIKGFVAYKLVNEKDRNMWNTMLTFLKI